MQALRNVTLLCLVVGVMIVFSGCVPGTNELTQTASAEGAIAGFWWGLWHGLILPFTFIASLFLDHVAIYEVHNSGGWYDFGFVLGVIIFNGGASRSGDLRK